MLSEYQKQLNRLYFFSNKVVSIGKVDYKFKLKPMATLIGKLKKQIEENVSKEIEEELTAEQIENRLRIFLPGEIKNTDLENTTFKMFYKVLIDRNIVSRKDINQHKDLIKRIIEEEIENFNQQVDVQEREEAKMQLEVLETLKGVKGVKEVKDERETKEETSSSKSKKVPLYRSPDKIRNLITTILNEKGYYEKDEENEEKLRRISSSDLERIFSEAKIDISPDKLAEEVYSLYENCKVPSEHQNLSLTSAKFIADILKKEKDIDISEYIVQLLMGKYSRVYDLKNIMLKNHKFVAEDCKEKGFII